MMRHICLLFLGLLVAVFAMLCVTGAIADAVLLFTTESKGWPALSHAASAIWGIGLGLATCYVIGLGLASLVEGKEAK